MLTAIEQHIAVEQLQERNKELLGKTLLLVGEYLSLPGDPPFPKERHNAIKAEMDVLVDEARHLLDRITVVDARLSLQRLIRAHEEAKKKED